MNVPVPTVSAQLLSRLDDLATDVGLLRRRLELATGAADRIAGHIQALHQLLEPSAAELANTTAPGDPVALDEAIRIVDERSRRLGGRLGGVA